MSEILPIEAIRAAGASDLSYTADDAVAPVADPDDVSRFEAAMATDAPSDVDDVDPVPFVDSAAAVWRTAQVDNQNILNRIRDLSSIGADHTPSSAELVELQYEVANLAFQQEVVAKVADKTSNAIQSLVKNQ